MKLRTLGTGLALSITVLLSACGKNLEGTYKDNLGVQKYEFTSDGKVYISTMGLTSEATYKVEDKKVKITKGKDETVIYDLNEDGSIRGPLGMELRPQPKTK